jgi:magnesium chelatase subunit D
VVLSDHALEQIAGVCAAFDVDGLRADIVTARTAVAHAAWHGRTTVDAEDIRAAARLALPHRRRRNPFDAPGLDESQLDAALNDQAGPDESGAPEEDPDPDDSPPNGGPPSGDATGPREEAQSGEKPAVSQPAGNSSTSVAAPAATFRTRRLEVPGVGAGAAGRRSRAETDTGRTVGSRTPPGPVRHLHLTATVMAAAPHQRERGRVGAGLLLRAADLRESRREGRESNLVLFLVDASGSMAARARMAGVKAAVLSLLMDAYQRRDKVGLISFRGAAAEVLLPPTSSVEVAAARLTTLPTGGRTPLEAGLLEARAMLTRERLRDPRRRPLLVIVTDGRHTSGGRPQRAAALLEKDHITSIVLDCESGPVRLGMAKELAEALGGMCLPVGDLAMDGLADSIRSLRRIA